MTKLLITIDTEGDNLWSKPSKIESKNARSIPRFQDLCEKYQLKPTYLTNYEIAIDEFFIEFGKDSIKRNTAEVGMHLHAWNSPPLHQLTENDFLHQPYLIEYSQSIISEKIKVMTEILENNFQTKMISHRAGRWAFNEFYAKKLIELGYEVDCSVTPRVSWKNHQGNPDGSGGIDYKNFPSQPYLINTDNISTPGDSPLLEVPMTIHDFADPLHIKILRSIKGPRRAINKIYPSPAWLRPNGFNLKSMIKTLDHAISIDSAHAEFMLHSSELMAGGNPNFPDKKSIDRLYSQMEDFFSYASSKCTGMTLKEFGIKYKEAQTA